MIPKAPFARLVREILSGVNSNMVKSKATDETDKYRVTPQCLMALQEAAEAYLVDLFEATQYAAVHGKRITIMCASFCSPAFVCIVQMVIQTCSISAHRRNGATV